MKPRIHHPRKFAEAWLCQAHGEVFIEILGEGSLIKFRIANGKVCGRKRWKCLYLEITNTFGFLLWLAYSWTFSAGTANSIAMSRVINTTQNKQWTTPTWTQLDEHYRADQAIGVLLNPAAMRTWDWSIVDKKGNVWVTTFVFTH